VIFMALRRFCHTPLPGYRHSLLIIFFAQIMVCKLSIGFRSASRVLDLFSNFIYGSNGPRHTTVRNWVLKLSYYKLHTIKHVHIKTCFTTTSPWAWIMDHSIQIGKVQCFLILGVDLSKYSFGRPIRREDCEPILLKPMFKSNGEEVCQAMYEACKKTGVPRQVCIDGGSDLGAGCKLFCRDNPGLFIIRDIAHKVANLLKTRLEHNKAWNEFTSLLSKIKSNLQQTSYEQFSAGILQVALNYQLSPNR